MAEVANLLHGQVSHVFGDASHLVAEKRTPKPDRSFRFAAKRRVVKAIDEPELRTIIEQREHKVRPRSARRWSIRSGGNQSAA